MDTTKQLLALAFCSLVSVAQAGEKEELLKLRNTTTNLIKELVKQGVLTDQVADEMIKKAESDAGQQAQAGSSEPLEEGEVRVPFVPEFVKDEIRQQVRAELRHDVVKDVMQEAKNQKWGVPDALPEWISRFKLSGDLRLRSQNDFMSTDNVALYYPDYQAINRAGGVAAAGLNGFLNTNHDRQYFRERFRLAIDTKITDGLKAGARLATGNMPDPVSTNQTMGNTGSQYSFNLDRAFLHYDLKDSKGFNWLTLSGGRIANPWYVGGGEFTGGSEMIWDTDLSFEGFAATFRHDLNGKSAINNELAADKHTVYATVGAFPMQESALSQNDKWLFGSQVGVDWGFHNHDMVRVAMAFYDYENVTIKPNTNTPSTCNTNSPENNQSVPQFLQFGNTLGIICNDNNNTFPGLYGLASEFKIVNGSFAYDLAAFAPHHLIVAADYAKNVAFNSASVQRLARVPVGDQTNAWQVRLDFGWPIVAHGGEWNVFTLYKYVQRDSVLDAYSDSDFHLGGTNAKGWVVGGNYGLMKNVWATGRWLSTDVISGPKYGNDVLQLDLNTRF
jgi:hypothetical protein